MWMLRVLQLELRSPRRSFLLGITGSVVEDAISVKGLWFIVLNEGLYLKKIIVRRYLWLKDGGIVAQSRSTALLAAVIV
jgi:hypothetical protein